MTPNIDFESIISYLENLGAQHSDINKVVRWNRAELQGQMRTENLESVLLIDAPEIYSSDNERNVHVHDCALTVLGKKNVAAPRLDDYEKQNEIIQHCQQICFELAARIQVDSYKSEEPSLKWLYGAVEKDSFVFIKVGPAFTNHLYGYRLEFVIKSREVYKIDTNKWLDL